MRTKIWNPVFFLILLLLFVPLWGPAGLAQEEGDDTSELTVTVGGWEGDVDGSPDVVAEYEPVDGDAEVGLEYRTLEKWGRLFLYGHRRGVEDQSYGLEFDIGRQLRSTTTFERFLHRLGKDPLTNLEAATNHGRYVHHTDLDPGDVYELSYRRLDHRTEYQPQGLAALALGFNYRRQERDGQHQALVVSHCDSCHVTSQTRPLDEVTEDLGLDARVTWAGGEAHAGFTRRRLREDVRDVSLIFDNALQPELRVPVFDNRVSFDSAAGPLPVHQRPDIDKDIFRAGLTLFDAGGFAVQVGGVNATTENRTTGLESDYGGYNVTAVRRFQEKWTLRLRGRYYDLDNDEVLVDIVEPAGIAGPHNGLTYRQVYGFDPDFLRRSALNRQVFESKVDLSYKLGKKAGKIRFLWELEDADRDFFEIGENGETAGTENIFGVRWWGRPKKGLRLHAGLRHGSVDNPVLAVNSGFSTLVSPRVPSPFVPTAAQYFEFQDARIADGTAEPESWDELKAGLTYLLGDKALSASYRYWDGDNDDGDFTDWERQLLVVTVSLTGAPSEKIGWHLAATHQESELKFPTFIPIFDG